jgi:hypothetical protein
LGEVVELKGEWWSDYDSPLRSPFKGLYGMSLYVVATRAITKGVMPWFSMEKYVAKGKVSLTVIQASRDDIQMLSRFLLSMDGVRKGQVDFFLVHPETLANTLGNKVCQFVKKLVEERQAAKQIITLRDVPGGIKVPVLSSGSIPPRICFSDGMVNRATFFGFLDRFQTAFIDHPTLLGRESGIYPGVYHRH